MNIAVIGGNGYIGKALITRLLQKTDATIYSLSPHAESSAQISERIVCKNTDIFVTDSLIENLKDCETVYYLVHMMGQKKRDFMEAEAEAAHSLVNAVKDTAVKKIIFLGGLGNDNDKLSDHLASRHKTGKILQKADAQVIEFRASMVIGKGSASYDIITNLVHRLPIMALPTWAKTLTQPIGLQDAISYLVAALRIPSSKDEVVEIGGPEPMTYEHIIRRYAKWKNKMLVFFHVPFVPLFVASWWLDAFTPEPHAKVGRVMVESLANPMVVTNRRAEELFPDIKVISLERSFPRI